MNPVETLTDEVLLLKLRDTEHDFVERKPRGQNGEWLRAAVAFANSAPIGWPAILFVGVDDDGNPQQGPEKLEDLSKSVVSTIEQAYPSIYFDVRPLHIGDRACLAVIVPGSEGRPHFAGKSYVREGPSTKEASSKQFDLLIAERSSQVYEIRKRIGETALVVVQGVFRHNPHHVREETRIVDCNRFFVTVEQLNSGHRSSYPLRRTDLSFDHARGILLLEVREEIFR